MSPSTSDDIRDFWEKRREPVGFQSLRTATSTLFQEHPIWIGVIAGLIIKNPTKPLRVADLGCGTGMVAEVLARLGCDVIAVDFAPSRAEQAAERLRAFPTAQVRVGDALNPPIEVGEVDAVISRNLVWLLPEPVAALRRWGQIVTPGGTVAAIDSTRRTSRHKLPRLQAALGMQKYPGGVAPGSPVNAEAPTPLSDVVDAAAAAALWQEAGLQDVAGIDLSWVSAARMQDWPAHTRWLRNDSYFAVTGAAPLPA